MIHINHPLTSPLLLHIPPSNPKALDTNQPSSSASKPYNRYSIISQTVLRAKNQWLSVVRRYLTITAYALEFSYQGFTPGVGEAVGFSLGINVILIQ